MKYLYDRSSNALTITFVEGRKYRDSEEIYDGVVVDYDTEGRPYAIEFLRANEFVDTRGLISGRPVKLSGSSLVDETPLDRGTLTAFRENLGISQRELASNLHIATELLKAWEEGTKQIENPELIRLALQAVEGNVRARFFGQIFQLLNESLQDYAVNAPDLKDSPVARR